MVNFRQGNGDIANGETVLGAGNGITKNQLSYWSKKKGYPAPDTVGAAIFNVAKFGGYLARKSDPPPGDQILWRGYSTLQIMAAGFELMLGLINDGG